MAAPCAWDVAPVCSGWDDYTPEQRADAIARASYLMWAATGRRYGLCPITVRPCNPSRGPALYQVFPVEWDSWGGGGEGGGFSPGLEGGQWFNRCSGGCSCQARCEVPLDGPTTTGGITQVTVNGDVVESSAYQVHDGYLLVRVDGQCWPTCADAGADPPAFQVTYLRGDPVPAAVLGATGILACELAQGAAGGPCRLPDRLVSLSRQGVEVEVDPGGGDFAELGLTGILDVDRIIAAVNPHRRTQRPQVFSPDLPPNRMVT